MKPTEVNFRTVYDNPVVHMVFNFENGTGASVLITNRIVTILAKTTITNTPTGWWESTYRERRTDFEVYPIIFDKSRNGYNVNNDLCNNEGYPRGANNRAEMVKILEKLKEMKG